MKYCYHFLSLLSATVAIVVKILISSLGLRSIKWVNPQMLRKQATSKFSLSGFRYWNVHIEMQKVHPPAAATMNADSNHKQLNAHRGHTNSTFLPYLEQCRRCYEQLWGGQEQKKRVKIACINQDELVDSFLLADPDSISCEFKGVKIHHKISNASIKFEAQSTTHQKNKTASLVGFPMVLLHGFGASVFSWNQVMKPLANVATSKVVAFDRPAFGLTSRVSVNSLDHSLNPYSTAFSALATVNFINLLAAEKAILVGHSAGSYVAVQTYFQAPQRVAAMILVAPAILAPFTSHNNIVKQQHTSKSTNFVSLHHLLHPIIHLVKRMVNMFISFSKKALSTLLLSSIGPILARISIDKFGISIIKYSWYDKNQVTDDILDGYTKPLRSKGWDKALAEFVAAMFTDSEPKSMPPLAKRLREISCPVLIITGDSDPITPYWNSKRLAEAIPGSCLEVIKNCGHIPHEEKPQEFVAIVDKFVHKVFS